MKEEIFTSEPMTDSPCNTEWSRIGVWSENNLGLCIIKFGFMSYPCVPHYDHRIPDQGSLPPRQAHYPLWRCVARVVLSLVFVCRSDLFGLPGIVNTQTQLVAFLWIHTLFNPKRKDRFIRKSHLTLALGQYGVCYWNSHWPRCSETSRIIRIRICFCAIVL